VTILLFIAIMALSQAPLVQDTYEESEARALTQTELAFAGSEHFEDVMNVVPGRCAMCHAREPYYDGIRRAPKNVLLETPADVAKYARQIYLQAGATHAMPPANVTYMEEDERALIRQWYADGAAELPFYLAGN
jgi:uncharacterized membrane protein